jgi:hypothetical protein
MKYIIQILVLVFFVSCQTNTLTNKEVGQYTIKGKEIGQAVLKKLGGNLMQQMKNGGVKQAIPFCNVAAIPLTEELSKKYNVSIKRTSHKLRNTKNKLTLKEDDILKHYITSISNGEKVKPIVTKDDNLKIHFYAPIKMKKKCLVCHGDISKQTDSIIKSYYPKDLATGFKEGDIRGLMSITFN